MLTLIIICAVAVYLIGCAFLHALWLSAEDRRYWSADEARLRWFHGVALWPAYLFAQLGLVLIVAPIAFLVHCARRALGRG